MDRKNKPLAMKILLPVDESACSAEAIHAVTERPWPAGTTIRVLSAVESVGYPEMGPMMFDAGGAFEKLQQQRTKEASRLTKRVANTLAAHGLATETVVHDGDPRSVIVDEAEDWKADLIVLGSHGYSGLKRWLLGSVAQSVVSHAPCSVEVVRHRASR